VGILEITIITVTTFLSLVILVLLWRVFRRADPARGDNFVLRQSKLYMWLTLIFLPGGIAAVGFIVWDTQSPTLGALLPLAFFIFFASAMWQNYKWEIRATGDTLTLTTTFGTVKEFSFEDFSRAEQRLNVNPKELHLYTGSQNHPAISVYSNMAGYQLFLERVEQENLKIEQA